jgi:hypothetical protein
MTLKKFLEDNPPAARCSTCDNPLFLVEVSEFVQTLSCRFCQVSIPMNPKFTVDTIKTPYGSMVVSVAEIKKVSTPAE